MSRKTIPVADVRAMVNHLLQVPEGELYIKAPGKDRVLTPEEALREGVSRLLEAILQRTGNYRGFGYQDGQITHYATRPGERTVITDETRRVYY